MVFVQAGFFQVFGTTKALFSVFAVAKGALGQENRLAVGNQIVVGVGFSAAIHGLGYHRREFGMIGQRHLPSRFSKVLFVHAS